MRHTLRISILIISLSLLIVPQTKAKNSFEQYLPLIQKPIELPAVEFRGIWVNRFDWTTPDGPPTPERIDEIVANIAYAGFNVIFFQVRGEADAYYDSSIEPWAKRMTGTLGRQPAPYWDPLAHMIEKAHEEGIQVHAYINTYPVASCNDIPAKTVQPTPLYHLLNQEHGLQNEQPTSLQWGPNDEVACQTYYRATPASAYFNEHIISVGQDLVTRYELDGLHLDHIRYGSEGASCDPVSEAAFGADCFSSLGYGDWQREQINQLVRRFYNEVVPLNEGIWLSAAVWPIHELNPDWGWPGFPEQGNTIYFQDSKAWIRDGYIHSISPMIYPGGEYQCPDNSYLGFERWETLVRDFQAGANGRFIIPGIGTNYCTFAEIEDRIWLAREIGTGGHALFAYFGLEDNDYFDDLAEGPYEKTAVVPPIPHQP
ncbi:MAG: family 10 glycosylhydrolase [Chloroflexota bacterium]